MPRKTTTEPVQEPDPELLAQAITALAIDVPISHVEQDQSGQYTLYLYGGQVLTWSPPKKSQPAKSQTSSRKTTKSRK